MDAREAGRILAAARAAKRQQEQTQAPSPGSTNDAARAVMAGEPELPLQSDNAAPPMEAPGEQTDEHREPAELPPIEAPRSWTKDEKERFQSYPRELQAYLSEREQQRDRELRQRQNEAAEERKAIAVERDAVARARYDYEQALPVLLQTLQQQQAGQFADIRTMDDVRKMAAEDPARYLQWDAAQKQLSAVHGELSATQQRQAHEAQQLWARYAQEQDRLLAEKVPDVNDPVKAPKLRASAMAALQDVGFNEDELNRAYNGQGGFSLRDHRLLSLIIDGVRFREAKDAAKNATAQPKPPVQRPGQSQGRISGAEAEIQALQAKLKQTGSDRVAAQLLVAQRRADQRKAPR